MLFQATMLHRIAAVTMVLAAPAAVSLFGGTIVVGPGFAGGIPVDESFRYPGYNLYGHLHEDLNRVTIGRNGPNNITMTDAVRGAMFTWNTGLALKGQDPNWSWVETNEQYPNPPYPHIHFRMSKMLPGGAEELDPPDDDYADIDYESGAAGANTLAFFRVLTRCDGCVWEAEIVFNRLAPWGLDGALSYDPVIVALHEMGHAMRLDHYTDANDRIIMGDGVVMRPRMMQGAHSTNPTIVGGIGFPRFPSALDIEAASVSASLMQPCPEPATLLCLAGGLIGLAGLRRFLPAKR